MRTVLRTAVLVLVLAGSEIFPLAAQTYHTPTDPPVQQAHPQPQAYQYSSIEIIDAGHRFFGTVSRGLAEIVERACSLWGLPNGYVLGQEAGGAFWAGVRYGEGGPFKLG